MKQTKAKSRQQIAAEYGICTKTLRRWIREKKLNIKSGLLSPKDLDLIYQSFGNPNEIRKNKN